jgi:hypothetical protein
MKLMCLQDCSSNKKLCFSIVPRKYHPPVLRHHRLATARAALQVLLGVAVSSLAVWLLLLAPNLRVRDIPYWSGLPVSRVSVNMRSLGNKLYISCVTQVINTELK